MSNHTTVHGHHPNYVKIWLLLVGLLVISVVGPMLGIRLVTIITAFGIALVKAYLVAKNFMHLNIEKPIVHWMLLIALAFMVLMFSGIAPDVMKHEGRFWQKQPVAHQAKPSDHGLTQPPASHGNVAPSSHEARPGAAATDTSQKSDHGERGGSH
jgi:caa(3)-type oxidase subunit IV